MFTNIRTVRIGGNPWYCVTDVTSLLGVGYHDIELAKDHTLTLSVNNGQTGQLEDIELCDISGLRELYVLAGLPDGDQAIKQPSSKDDKTAEEKQENLATIENDDKPTISMISNQLKSRPAIPKTAAAVSGQDMVSNPESQNLPSLTQMEPDQEVIEKAEYTNDEIEAALEALKEVVIKYLTTPLPKGWEKMKSQDRRDYLDGKLDLEAEMVREKVCLEEIIIECFRQAELLGNPEFQKNLSKVMASLPDWELHKSIKSYPPYERGIGYKRKI